MKLDWETVFRLSSDMELTRSLETIGSSETHGEKVGA